MKENSGWNTEGWKRAPEHDAPELYHRGSLPMPFPQQVGFEDEQGQVHVIARLKAIALGLIGIKDVKEKSVCWEDWEPKR